MKFKEKDIKVIVCDLDGTLLREDKTISKDSEEFLIALQQEGYTLVLASGRGHDMIEPYAKQLHMEKYNGYIVSYNGQQIEELASNTMHQNDFISLEMMDKIFTFAKNKSLQFIVEGDKKYYIYTPKRLFVISLYMKYVKIRQKQLQKKNKNHKMYNKFMASSDVEMLVLKSINQIKKPMPKIGLSQTSKVLKKNAIELSELYSKDIEVLMVSPNWLDIVPKGVNKALGLKWISDRLNIPLSQFIAFGDSENDVEMLQEVGVGIAMNNGMENVKKYASYTSEFNNEENGVIIELKSVLNKA